MKAAIALTTAILAVTGVASADVTITMSMTGRSGSGPHPGGPSGRVQAVEISGTQVSFYKGSRFRSDTTTRGVVRTTIVDLQAKTVLVIDHAARSASRHAMPQAGGGEKDATADIRLTPTGKTRMLLDQSCDEYAWSITFVDFPSSSGAARKVRTTISATAWIASGSPGGADYRTFYAIATEQGLPINERPPGAPQGFVRATAALQVAVAAKGVPYALETTIALENITQPDIVLDGQPQPNGGPAPQKGDGGASSMGVTKISTDPIPDSAFDVPAGYKLATAAGQ